MKLKIVVPIVVALIAIILGVSVFQGVLNSPTPETQHQYSVSVAFPNVQFKDPVGIYAAGDQSNQLFVVEQAGIIKVFENNESVNTAAVFLNISDRVISGGELGLLGVAFPRQFNESGFFYVYYLSLIHISEPTRLLSISYAVFCL